MYRLLAIALSSIFAMLLVARAAAPADGPSAGTPAQVAAADPTAASATGFAPDQPLNATVIRRDSTGQFHLDAAVNGTDTRFLIDTGSDVVALTVADAEELGIEVNTAMFRPLVHTASGTGYGTVVHLDSLAVGGSEFRDVDAAVIDGLRENLLGQSILGRLGRVDLQGDRMVIHHD